MPTQLCILEYHISADLEGLANIYLHQHVYHFFSGGGNLGGILFYSLAIDVEKTHRLTVFEEFSTHKDRDERLGTP